ncbi:1,4-dihydroxy-2-naphthoate polyprenyltransferase [Chondrinema litorale]|uniref:1,4-dihydroxy-2-naphthoate polyprenyltransferase n=1 Tax=Chondrinema litorale TaxID=2994555 RepID=UPI00254441B7|nr:1,4-dihydroxy-2-naphthoate polyprenyltransferase [Chondrinema litorale]UZR93958.1 1,4-dihydroxy-2-naphthoate polyprenyltransferase [Chondrinema litorale]
MKSSIADWIEAFRLRTLPLSLASIGMGSFLAASYGNFDPIILTLCITTTIFLQVLSNLANDYGDSKHGADSVDRLGPSRSVQAGKITANAMKNAMILFVLFSLASGIGLLYYSLGVEKILYFLIFLVLGVLSIGAAITYTAGSKPYGYAGLGDISVMIFFGWVGVAGTFYLFTESFTWDILLPASSCGFFATAVLNINNIRDIESDKKAGKRSIPVRIGATKARFYHLILLISGLITAFGYVILHYQTAYQFLFLLVLPFLGLNIKAVYTKKSPSELDPFLKQMALTSLLFVMSFGIGQLI